jgi:hypothetical protein
MPFTPFHLGPALCFGIPLRNYIHAPTFILANVVLDFEPLLVLVFGLNYPLHGYLHTFLAAIVIGFALGLAMFLLEGRMHPLYKTLQLEPETTLQRSRFTIAGVAGAMLHVLFDSPLYSDIQPFFPLNPNPMYGSISSSGIFLVTFIMGILGIAFYILILLLKVIKKHRTLRQNVVDKK